MTQLANANLLDESVANSGSLKSRRLNKTAMTASNPNPQPQPQPQPMRPTTTLKKVDIKEEEEEDNDFELNDRADDYINYNNNLSKMQEKPNDDDKKILGMKPALFWTLLVGVAAVGGYFGYKYIKKKGLIGGVKNAVPNAAPNAVPNAVPNVPNVTNNIT